MRLKGSTYTFVIACVLLTSRRVEGASAFSLNGHTALSQSQQTAPRQMLQLALQQTPPTPPAFDQVDFPTKRAFDDYNAFNQEMRLARRKRKYPSLMDRARQSSYEPGSSSQSLTMTPTYNEEAHKDLLRNERIARNMDDVARMTDDRELAQKARLQAAKVSEQYTAQTKQERVLISKNFKDSIADSVAASIANPVAQSEKKKIVQLQFTQSAINLALARKEQVKSLKKVESVRQHNLKAEKKDRLDVKAAEHEHVVCNREFLECQGRLAGLASRLRVVQAADARKARIIQNQAAFRARQGSHFLERARAYRSQRRRMRAP